MEWAQIGELVATAREDRGWTRQEASEASGVSVSTWADLEKARKTSYRRATLRDVSAALDWPRSRIAVLAGLEAAEEVEPEPPPADSEPTTREMLVLVLDRLDSLTGVVTEMYREAEGLRAGWNAQPGEQQATPPPQDKRRPRRPGNG